MDLDVPTRWRVPAGMTGDLSLVRIGTGMAGDDAACPERLAAKARPRVKPKVYGGCRRPPLETFALDPVMEALDSVEYNHVPVDVALAQLETRRRPLHPGLTQWVGHAVRRYVAADMAENTGTLCPVPYHWVLQSKDQQAGRLWELYAWGRRYQSPDGSLREFRFFRFGTAGGRTRDPAQLAIAAYTAARGTPASWPGDWADPFCLRDARPVERVRVVEAGCADGSRAVLFDGTPGQADALYASDGRSRVREMITGGPAKPGAACADCKLVTACDTLPRIPNLLGITDPKAPLRTWSVSDGRYYDRCPAQEHLRRLSLRRERGEYDPAATRGQAVHAWLERNHARLPHTPCSLTDVPGLTDDWSSGRWHVTGEQARIGARMLACHVQACAFQHGEQVTETRLEPVVALHDTAANVIVIAKADMIYLDGGSWVWRETKTTQKAASAGADPLDTYPQLALAVLILHENALGADPSQSRVELEILRPDTAEISLIDPTDPERAARAREVVRSLAGQWRGDESFATRPGPHCQTCPVSQWCPDSAAPSNA